VQPGCEGLRVLSPEAAGLPPPDWQALRHVVAAAVSDDVRAICPPARAAEVVTVIDRLRRQGHYRNHAAL